MKFRSALFPLLFLAAFSMACSLTARNSTSTPQNLRPTQGNSEAPETPTPRIALNDPVSSVMVYLVALEDGGVSGEKIGCGDSLIPITLMIEPTNGALRASLVHLLAIRDQKLGESGLYNALYQSELIVDEIQVVNGVTEIQLSGNLRSGGVCDDPRIIGQHNATALQFNAVSEVHFFVNGLPLKGLLSGQ